MESALRPRQLAFELPHAESFARDDFIAGASNVTARTLVDRWPDWPDRTVALTGPAGAGKSHLASIWAADTGARILSARLLGEVSVPTALATGALVLDDAMPGTFDERALFHLLNLVREERAFLLITTRAAPAGWPAGLPDLTSRLRAMPVVELAPPDDLLLRGLIVKLAADRQLAFDEALVGYLVNRIERSFTAVREAVARLDREAMRQHRPVTRALAAELYRDPAA